MYICIYIYTLHDFGASQDRLVLYADQQIWVSAPCSQRLFRFRSLMGHILKNCQTKPMFSEHACWVMKPKFFFG